MVRGGLIVTGRARTGVRSRAEPQSATGTWAPNWFGCEAYDSFYVDLFGLSINGPFTENRDVGTILNGD